MELFTPKALTRRECSELLLTRQVQKKSRFGNIDLRTKLLALAVLLSCACFGIVLVNQIHFSYINMHKTFSCCPWPRFAFPARCSIWSAGSTRWTAMQPNVSQRTFDNQERITCKVFESLDCVWHLVLRTFPPMTVHIPPLSYSIFQTYKKKLGDENLDWNRRKKTKENKQHTRTKLSPH